MRMQPIDDTCMSEAAALLSRGFPDRGPEFWNTALERLSAYRKSAKTGPIGQLMLVEEKPAGVILTIGSRRSDPNVPPNFVNLSSWYVDERYRWLAPRMLQQVVAEKSLTYTDLSPSAETRIVNERLGFTTVSEGVFLFPLPWAAIRCRRTQARVLSFSHIPKNALSDEDYAMLAQHRDLGCVAAALDVDGRHYPLLFYPTRRMGLSVARLLFAESRMLVTDNLRLIARFLLREGVLFLTVHANRDERMPGGILWSPVAPVQVKGKWHCGRVDHAFSELVLLRL